MFQPSFLVEQRRYVRVSLQLPVRLRWMGPLRQTTEVTETLDVSRGGLMVYRPEPCAEGATVWVTFPFDPGDSAGQPETPARVVRVRTTPTGGNLIGLEFELPKRAVRSVGGFNRRAAERMPLAVPVSVWMGDLPWPEESMTMDVSETGLMFRSARQYQVGEIVRVAPHGTPLPGSLGRKQRHARVVRIEPLKGAPEQRVALSFFPSLT